MRRTGQNLSKDHRELMVKLYMAGTPKLDLAEQFGVHPDYIRVAALRSGHSRKRPGVIVMPKKPAPSAPVARWHPKPGLVKAAGC